MLGRKLARAQLGCGLVLHGLFRFRGQFTSAVVYATESSLGSKPGVEIWNRNFYLEGLAG